MDSGYPIVRQGKPILRMYRTDGKHVGKAGKCRVSLHRYLSKEETANDKQGRDCIVLTAPLAFGGRFVLARLSDLEVI